MYTYCVSVQWPTVALSTIALPRSPVLLSTHLLARTYGFGAARFLSKTEYEKITGPEYKAFADGVSASRCFLLYRALYPLSLEKCRKFLRYAATTRK